MYKLKSCVILILAMVNIAACTSNPVLDKKKNSAVDQYYAADSAYRMGDYQKAQSLYHKLELLQPTNITILLRLGNLYLRQKNFRKAEKYYRRVLAIKPNSERAHYNLAVLHLEISEKHFKYYAANQHDDAGSERLVKLLNAIQVYSSSRVKTNNPLDALADIIVKGHSGESTR